jgi:hypothetical protein
MKSSLYLSIVFLFLTVSSCANKFKYFGNDYPETEDVKIYFREADIDKEFEVIGKLYCDFKINTKDRKIQNTIMKKVMQHGGDAAIFGQMSENRVGSVSSTVGASKRFGKRNGTRVGGSVSSSSDKRKDQMEITVIKYKPIQ